MLPELTLPQAEALRRLARRRSPLLRNRSGWDGVATATIYALKKRGLLEIDHMAGCCGAASITPAGRAILDREAAA